MGNHFSISKHFSIIDLIENLPNSQIRYSQLNDDFYDYDPVFYDRTLGKGQAEIEIVTKKLSNSFFSKSKY